MKPSIAIIATEVLPVPPVLGGGLETVIWETLQRFQCYQAIVYSGLPKRDEWERVPLIETHHGHEFRKIIYEDRASNWNRLRHFQFNDYFAYLYKIAKDLNSRKPAMVHIHSRPWFLPILKRLLTYRPKLILQNHNHYFKDMPKAQVARFLSQTDFFLAPSQFTLQSEVLTRFPEWASRSAVVANGVNTDHFRSHWELRSEDRSALRRHYRFSETDIVILFAGRLTPHKGIHLLMKAWLALAPQYPQLKLWVVGSHWFGDTDKDPFARELETLAQPMGDRVKFAGFIPHDQLPDVYATADVFAGLSLVDETFGLAFVEAMASGLSVIASTRGALPEIVVNGETGFCLPDPENIATVTTALEALIKDKQLRQRMGQAGRKRVEANFTWEQTATATEAVYEKLLQ